MARGCDHRWQTRRDHRWETRCDHPTTVVREGKTHCGTCGRQLYL
ncbi:hypothetical protein [Streptomyces sp. AJS327]|nr:hypothetical protein [Streptomyces sp. AJS327]